MNFAQTADVVGGFLPSGFLSLLPPRLTSPNSTRMKSIDPPILPQKTTPPVIHNIIAPAVQQHVHASIPMMWSFRGKPLLADVRRTMAVRR